MRLLFTLMAIAFSLTPPSLCAEGIPKVPEPVFDQKRGVWQYSIDSPHQKGRNVVEVLLPDKLDPARRYQVLYVLPVETGIGGRYGDGIKAIRQINAQNVHNLICVMPTFDTVPWFGDHPTDTQIHQETYFVKTVVPLIDARYPTLADREGRLLFGYSKSGWGAYTLICRHPDMFGYAASWDSPLMLDEKGFKNFGIPSNMGTAENFANYLPTRLFADHAAEFQKRSRIVLTGHFAFGSQPGNRFTDHTAQMHEHLSKVGVKHEYDNSIHLPHHWESGWVKPTLDLLIKIADSKE